MSADLAISLFWLAVIIVFAVAAAFSDAVEAWLYGRNGGKYDKNDH